MGRDGADTGRVGSNQSCSRKGGTAATTGLEHNPSFVRTWPRPTAGDRKQLEIRLHERLACCEYNMGIGAKLLHILAPSYFPTGLPLQYRNRSRVSPPSSGWIGVVPLRLRHQNIDWGTRDGRTWGGGEHVYRPAIVRLQFRRGSHTPFVDRPAGTPLCPAPARRALPARPMLSID